MKDKIKSLIRVILFSLILLILIKIFPHPNPHITYFLYFLIFFASIGEILSYPIKNKFQFEAEFYTPIVIGIVVGLILSFIMGYNHEDITLILLISITFIFIYGFIILNKYREIEKNVTQN